MGVVLCRRWGSLRKCFSTLATIPLVYQRNRYRGKSKGCILKDAQQEWKSTYVKNPTLLSEYLAPREGEKAFTVEESHEGDEILMDFGFQLKEEPAYLDSDVFATAIDSPILSPESESPFHCLQMLLMSYQLLRAVQHIGQAITYSYSDPL